MCSVRLLQIFRIRESTLCFALCLQHLVIASLICKALAEITCLELMMRVNLMIAVYFLSISDLFVS